MYINEKIQGFSKVIAVGLLKFGMTGAGGGMSIT